LRFLDAVADTDPERHKELSDWIGDYFDPQALSADPVIRRLTSKPRRSSATKVNPAAATTQNCRKDTCHRRNPGYFSGFPKRVLRS
jgi:hypothetical protein